MKTTKKKTAKVPTPTPAVRPDQTAIRQRVTDLMVKALTEGTPPWRQPWAGGAGLSAPYNFHSHRHYHGINPLLLLFSSMAHGFTSPCWGTQAQWEKYVKATLKPKQSPTYVIFYTLVPIVEKGKQKLNLQGKPILYPLMREYPLYNADQLDAPSERLDRYRTTLKVGNASVEPNYVPADILIDATDAEIVYGGLRACYERDNDRILCPPKNTFDSMGDFYETVFHELVHWTEHPKRVGQKKGHQYAFGELVAEIGACMLLLEIGVPMAEQMLESSKPYVKAWAARMGSDPKFIFDAATQAGKAIDYILAFKPKEKKKRGAA